MQSSVWRWEVVPSGLTRLSRVDQMVVSVWKELNDYFMFRGGSQYFTEKLQYNLMVFVVHDFL